MKKLLVVLFGFLLFSCSNPDDSLVTRSELIPIESAVVPEEFILGNLYRIDVTYLRPSTCHAFSNIYFVADANERTVAVVTTVFDSNNNCEEIATELEASFNFKATEPGSYIFKFWEGTDSNGDDVYLTVEVPVIS